MPQKLHEIVPTAKQHSGWVRGHRVIDTNEQPHHAFQPQCRCGWEGDIYLTDINPANDALHTHLKEVTP